MSSLALETQPLPHAVKFLAGRDFELVVPHRGSQQRAEGIKVKEVCNKKLQNQKEFRLCLPACGSQKSVNKSGSVKGENS